MRKKTIEEVDALLADRGFVRVGEYAGNTTTLTPLRCKTCDHTWLASMNNIRAGHGCPACSAVNKTITVEKIDAILADRGFVRDGDYVGNISTPTPLRCKTCDHTWHTTMNSIQQGTGCPNCAGNSPVTVAKVDAILADRGFVRDGDYVGNTRNPTPIRCKTCDHTWRARMTHIQQGKGCPACSGKAPVTVEKVDAILADRGFVRDGDYVGNTRTPTPLRCKTCDHTWRAGMASIQRGIGCPNCARDRLQPNGIYHLHHPEIPHQYIGISWKPKYRLKQHQEDTGPRGILARELAAPYEFTVEEVHGLLATAVTPPEDVATWHNSNPFGSVDYGAVVHDTPWDALPERVKAKPARVPRFVAEWVETELIRSMSVHFPSDNPFSAAGKVKLVNIAKN